MIFAKSHISPKKKYAFPAILYPMTPFLYRHVEKILDDSSLSQKPLDLYLSNYFRKHKNLGSTDRRVIGNTIYGMARWKNLIEYFAPKDPIDFYQKICWETLSKDSSIPTYIKVGLPQFLYTRFVEQFGETKAQELGRILNETAPTTIRANSIKISQGKLLEILGQKFPVSKTLIAKAGISLQKREPLFALPEFKEGLFELQDEGSQLIAEEVKPKPGDTVLDYCSGSGGKTLAFAHLLQGRGQIYLHDIRPQILQEARRRLKRAGIQNSQCLPPNHTQLQKLIGKCDWVLVDAPCSGTGTLRRNVDQKWKISPEFIAELTVLQKKIVQEAVRYVKPGGRLVYATCSLLQEENETQVKEFLKSLPLELEKEPTLLLPQSQGMDGFFSAVLKKHKL